MDESQILWITHALDVRRTDPSRFDTFANFYELPFAHHHPEDLLPIMSTANGHATSASTFGGLPAPVKPLCLTEDIHDAFRSISHIIDRTAHVRLLTVLDAQTSTLADGDDWESLATIGTKMVESDIRRLRYLQKLIHAACVLNEEVLRSWNPDRAAFLDSNPNNHAAAGMQWTGTGTATGYGSWN